MKAKSRVLFFAASVILILIIQVANLIHWKNQKGGFFIDELYTVEYACTYNNSVDYHNYIYTMPEFKESEWLDVNPFKQRFEFSQEKSCFNLSLAEFVSLQRSRNPYFTLLNLVYSAFGYGSDVFSCSIWLNIFLFVVSQMLLCFVVYKITGSQFAVITSMILYGFAGVTISLVIYVRFYIFAAICISIVYLIQYLIWKEERMLRQIGLEALLGIVLYITMRTQEFVAVLFAFFCVMLTIGMLIRKEYIKSVLYFGPIAFGGVFYLYKANILQQIFNADLEDNSHISNIIKNILDFNSDSFESSREYWMDIIQHNIFGSKLSMLMIALYVFMFILLVVVDKPDLGTKGMFVLTILISCLGYSIFHFIIGYTWRYMVFAFVGWIIVFAYIVAEFNVLFPDKYLNCRYIVCGVLVGVMLYGAIRTYNSTGIDYIYAEDKPVLDIIRRDYANYDSLVIHEVMKNGYGHLYEAVYNAGYDTKMKYITENSYLDEKSETLPRYLLWTHRGAEILGKDVIASTGYSITYLGSTHISDIYVCSYGEEKD